MADVFIVTHIARGGLFPVLIDTLSIRRYEIKKVEYDYREMKET